MIRCVGAALRGDGNPPEVPVIRTVLRAYNGVWGVPIKHMSAALCAHKCRACRTTLPNDFAKQSIVSYIFPEGALIKDGLRLSVSAPFLRQRIYTLIRERYDGAFLGALRPCSLASSIEDSTSRPSELRKRTLVLVLGQVVLTEPLRFRLGHPMDHSNAAGSPRRFAS